MSFNRYDVTCMTLYQNFSCGMYRGVVQRANCVRVRVSVYTGICMPMCICIRLYSVCVMCTFRCACVCNLLPGNQFLMSNYLSTRRVVVTREVEQSIS